MSPWPSIGPCGSCCSKTSNHASGMRPFGTDPRNPAGRCRTQFESEVEKPVSRSHEEHHARSTRASKPAHDHDVRRVHPLSASVRRRPDPLSPDHRRPGHRQEPKRQIRDRQPRPSRPGNARHRLWDVSRALQALRAAGHHRRPGPHLLRSRQPRACATRSWSRNCAGRAGIPISSGAPCRRASKRHRRFVSSPTSGGRQIRTCRPSRIGRP